MSQWADDTDRDALDPFRERQLWVVTLRLRVLATDPLDALYQGYAFMDGDNNVRREPKDIEEDLKDVRLATPAERRRRRRNIGRAS